MRKFKYRMLWISENENFKDLTMEELQSISVNVTTFLATNDNIVIYDEVTAILLKLCWKFIVVDDGHNFIYNYWDQID